VGDISVSGHVKGDDVSIGSSIDIQVGESVSESLPTVPISESLPTGVNLESLFTVAIWGSDTSVLEPLHTVAISESLSLGSKQGCDQDTCKVGVSVGAGVCGVVAGVGGVATVATTCVATAWFTFGLSCAVAGAVWRRIRCCGFRMFSGGSSGVLGM